jgi:hypothetical protein
MRMTRTEAANAAAISGERGHAWSHLIALR